MPHSSLQIDPSCGDEFRPKPAKTSPLAGASNALRNAANARDSTSGYFLSILLR